MRAPPRKCGRCGEEGHNSRSCPYGGGTTTTQTWGTSRDKFARRKVTGDALGSILYQELRPFGLIDPYDLGAPAHEGSGVPMAGLREALDRAAQRIYEYMTRDD